MQRARVFLFLSLVLGLGVLVAAVAVGQVEVLSEGMLEVVPEVERSWAELIEAALLTWLPRVVIVASMITAAFPSGNKFMRLVDRFAGAWGKARNAPTAQRWGR